MEIVLAVLLLFGGFTLGSITANKGDDEPQSTPAMPNVDAAADLNRVAQALHQSDPTRCHSDRAIIYRDLTAPYHSQVERPVIEGSDCEGGCPGE